MSRKQEYEDYLRSDKWKKKREIALKYADYRCQLCNSHKSLHVHHRYYPGVLGTEKKNDLTVLCKACHEKFHGKEKVAATVSKKQLKKNKRKSDQEKVKELSGPVKKYNVEEINAYAAFLMAKS